MKKILLSIICLTSFAFMQDECSEITNPEECYDMGCEWVSDSNDPTTGNGSCVEPEDTWESECTGLSYEDCEYLDFCEWIQIVMIQQTMDFVLMLMMIGKMMIVTQI